MSTIQSRAAFNKVGCVNKPDLFRWNAKPGLVFPHFQSEKALRQSPTLIQREHAVRWRNAKDELILYLLFIILLLIYYNIIMAANLHYKKKE